MNITTTSAVAYIMRYRLVHPVLYSGGRSDIKTRRLSATTDAAALAEVKRFKNLPWTEGTTVAVERLSKLSTTTTTEHEEIPL